MVMRVKRILILLKITIILSALLLSCDFFTPHLMIDLTKDIDLALGLYTPIPFWSPKDGRIYFSALDDQGYGIWSINSAGEDLQLLFHCTDYRLDDNDILTTSDIADDGTMLFNLNDDSIFSYSPADLKLVKLFDGRFATIKGTLNDSYNIAYCQPLEGIYLSDAHHSPPILIIAGTVWLPHWSPDGKQLAYEREIFDDDNDLLESQLCVFDIETREERVLLSNDSLIMAPHFSNDGTWIAYTLSFMGMERTEVCIIPTDGGDPIRLTEYPPGGGDYAGAAFPTWSPDDTWISFELEYRGIWKVSVE